MQIFPEFSDARHILKIK